MSIELIHQSTPVARKRHICDVCLTPIEPGTLYDRSVNKMDYVFTWKEHVECGRVGSASIDRWLGEGYDSESVYEWLADSQDSLTDEQKIVWDRFQSHMIESEATNE